MMKCSWAKCKWLSLTLKSHMFGECSEIPVELGLCPLTSLLTGEMGTFPAVPGPALQDLGGEPDSSLKSSGSCCHPEQPELGCLSPPHVSVNSNDPAGATPHEFHRTWKGQWTPRFLLRSAGLGHEEICPSSGSGWENLGKAGSANQWNCSHGTHANHTPRLTFFSAYTRRYSGRMAIIITRKPKSSTNHACLLK